MAKPASSKCVIEIQFDRPDGTYKSGERIAGAVEILPGADMQCRKVALTARWVARGKGSEDAADVETVFLPGGAWRNNEKVTHAFDLAAPRGPLSFDGDSFDIRWYLKAEADLPAASDAVAVRKFKLTHGDGATPGLPFSVTDAYNPFAALGPETAKPAANRPRPPAFYTALSWLPRLTVLPVVAVILGYFIGMREEYFPDGYLTAIVWGLVFLGAAFVLSKVVRRRMLAKRREALNRLHVRPPEPGAKPPRPPGKFWVKFSPDDSRRGWTRSIASLALGGAGLLLMAVGIINVAVRSWSPESAAYLGAAVAGTIITTVVRSGWRPSWRFIKTHMALGHVEVALTPEKLRCGDDVYMAVDFRTSLPARLVEATAALECYEVAEEYYKDMRTLDIDKIGEMFAARREQHKRAQFARIRRIHFQAVTLAAGRALLPQESASLSGRIAIPADAPPTFLAVGNKILWFMAVRMTLGSGIRWSVDIPVYLQP